MAIIFDSNIYKKLKGFDESYFMYVEDCDIFYRAKKLNFKIHQNSKIQVIHFAQNDSKKKIVFFLYHLFSLFLFWFKILREKMR